MQDKPSADILLEAVSEFLLKEILPIVKDNEDLSYKTLVSWNTLQILSREWKLSEKLMEEDVARFLAYFSREKHWEEMSLYEKKEIWKSLHKELSQKIRDEKIYNPSSIEWNLVKQSLKAKLEISNPKFFS